MKADTVDVDIQHSSAQYATPSRTQGITTGPRRRARGHPGDGLCHRNPFTKVQDMTGLNHEQSHPADNNMQKIKVK